jgi:1-acyl-sn-glycerol-3-phosphate acyltransferase
MSESVQITKWDPELVKRLMGLVRFVVKFWFRSEVRGLQQIPKGGVLVVSNHSGGLLPMDVPVFAADFYAMFGYDRPVYTLTHDMLLTGPAARLMARAGFIPASRANAAAALRAGGVVVVFPGSGHDAFRPTAQQNEIDFAGHTGYVSTAIEAGVPIVPAVSIGGQETQLYLGRGTWLAQRMPLRRQLFRSGVVPISAGFPFGLSAVFPPNLPLPSKIVTQVLDPIDITAASGDEPDVAAVDEHVRSVMQEGLNQLAAQRRFPVLG